MAYLNKVFLIGNLTRDPELRVTPKGTAVCQFGLAVNRQFKDESGATRDETAFIDIEAWGKQGELVSKYLQKGSLAFIEGRLKFDSWEDKTERPEAQQAQGRARERSVPLARRRRRPRPAPAASAEAAAPADDAPAEPPGPAGPRRTSPGRSDRQGRGRRPVLRAVRPAQPDFHQHPTPSPSWLTTKYC